MKGLLFIIGAPRSGKTTTHDILASSGKFAWISNLQNSYPRSGIISFLNRKYDIPSFGLKAYSKKKRTYLTAPVQSNDFWKNNLPDFELERFEEAVPLQERDPPGLKTGENIPEKHKERTRKVVEDICRWQGKGHLLSEYALWSRMSFFSEVFSNTKFLHVIRDGRAVAYEYKKMIERGIYPEKKEMEWWIKGWPKEWREEFNEKYSSILTFCAFQWKFVIKMIREDSENIPYDNYEEVKYRDVVEKPRQTFSNILDFYGSEYNQRIERYLDLKDLENMNHRWRRELKKSQKDRLNRIIQDNEYKEILDL